MAHFPFQPCIDASDVFFFSQILNCWSHPPSKGLSV
jgi:hypothetical protein